MAVLYCTGEDKECIENVHSGMYRAVPLYCVISK